jgi:hypothetical protein
MEKMRKKLLPMVEIRNSRQEPGKHLYIYHIHYTAKLLIQIQAVYPRSQFKLLGFAYGFIIFHKI